MTEPTRIRAQTQGDKAVVRVLMNHEMESGHRKDTSGKYVTAWHIQEVLATWNGKTVFTAEWGGGVSKNPYLQFTIKGARAGDKVAISWRDNKGATRTDEIVLQ